MDLGTTFGTKVYAKMDLGTIFGTKLVSDLVQKIEMDLGTTLGTKQKINNVGNKISQPTH